MKLILATLFLAAAYLLPFLTGQIQTIGQQLCPMHLPVLLCGFVCGPFWGLAVGAVAPILIIITLISDSTAHRAYAFNNKSRDPLLSIIFALIFKKSTLR
ncbi:MAG: hypothetical protein J5593_01395 [Bacteroidaceae bacterium]|nr:hypothetical protein [Bacteroidaceae bacterium]